VNLVKAVKLAKERGATTIGMLGFDGGALARLVDHKLHVRSNHGEYGPVEDVHLMLAHVISRCLRED
jgi:D-sedoheptulose 7-phosphate isomerase